MYYRYILSVTLKYKREPEGVEIFFKMGCTWIKFLNCYYGYGVRFDEIFEDTCYEIENEYYEDILQEYEYYVADGEEQGKIDFQKDYKHVKYDCSSLVLLKKEFKAYIAEKHPELKDVENMPNIFITCDKYIGLDESFGHPDNVYIVWGYELAKKAFSTKQSNIQGMFTKSVGFYFPKDAKALFKDFLDDFKAKHCIKIEKQKRERYSFNPFKGINLCIFGNNKIC